MAGVSEESVNCLLGGKEMAAVRKKQWCKHRGRARGRKMVVTNTTTQDCAIAIATGVTAQPAPILSGLEINQKFSPKTQRLP